MTREEFEKAGYRLLVNPIDGEIDIDFECSNGRVFANHCEKYCEMYYQCQYIADMDDAVKAFIG